MSQLLEKVDAQRQLAGTNKLELLIFKLGTDGESGARELYGINVCKVREVMRIPQITRAPEMPRAVRGMVSLRGKLVTVVDLATYAGLRSASLPSEDGENTRREVMIVTEFNGVTQALVVEAVDTILRVEWSAMRAPPQSLAGQASGLVTAVTELAGGRLVMMLDLEQLVGEALSEEALCTTSVAKPPPGKTVLLVDDSPVARAQIARTLDALQVAHIGAVNGIEAWLQLTRIADGAKAQGRHLRDVLQLVVTDLEMPELDGYTLVKRIRTDPRFDGLPVIMHSSVSGAPSGELRLVGMDDYISKFDPVRLAEAISARLAPGRSN